MANSTINKTTRLSLSKSKGGVENTTLYEWRPTPQSLAKTFSSTEIGPKNGGYFLRCAGTQRNNENTSEEANILILDGDRRINENGEIVDGAPDPNLVHEILTKLGVFHFIYTSHSNDINYHKYRVIIPCSYRQEQLLALLEYIFNRLHEGGVMLAPVAENKAWSQAWYFPRVPDEKRKQLFRFYKYEGSFIDAEVIYKDWLAKQSAPEEPPPLKPIKSFNTQSGLISPIHEFNKQFAVSNLLERNGYIKKGDRFLRPESSSGIPGIQICINLSDGTERIFSHGGDILNDGFAHDAFDVYRLLECNGDEKTALNWSAEITKHNYQKNAMTINDRSKVNSKSSEKFNPPKGYICTQKGVQKIVENGNNEWITFKPVQVTASTRDESGNNWGVLVRWADLDNKEHEVAIPKKLFHAQGTELAQLLADGGLQIVPGKEKELLRYLAAFNIDERLIAASCTGWMGNSFVLPNESINEPENQRIVYQPAGLLSNISRAIHNVGTLEQWQQGISKASPMVIFFVCASLSAPVRFKVGIEAGGFHAYNLTSRGKTTMLQVAASVWGNGVDPAIAGGDEAYIQRWNSTSNALEAKAEAFNDLPMVIDEIGEGDPREFGQTIYRVISGTGRGRSDRSGGLRDSKSWRVTILSAGEVAVSDFIESGGGHIKGGQIVRLVDIDLDATENLFDNAEQVDAMKKLCATHYGHAGAAMLKAIPDLNKDWADFDQTVIGDACTNIASRVRTRFALVAYTGVIAARAGILPWSEKSIINAAKTAYLTWHNQVSTVSDIDRAVVSVSDFIMKHESRFEYPNGDIPSNRAGWFRDISYRMSLKRRVPVLIQQR